MPASCLRVRAASQSSPSGCLISASGRGHVTACKRIRPYYLSVFQRHLVAKVRRHFTDWPRLDPESSPARTHMWSSFPKLLRLIPRCAPCCSWLGSQRAKLLLRRSFLGLLDKAGALEIRATSAPPSNAKRSQKYWQSVSLLFRTFTPSRISSCPKGSCNARSHDCSQKAT